MTRQPSDNIEVARRNALRAARKVDIRGDSFTHRALMRVLDALGDAAEADEMWRTKRHLQAQAERPKLIPTPWRH